MHTLTADPYSANQNTLMAWVEDEGIAARIRSVVEDIANLACEIAVVDKPLTAANSHARREAEIGLIELREVNEDRLEMVERMAESWREDSRLIVIARNPSPEIIARLARAGIEDVLSQTCSEAELMPALIQASARIGRGGQGRIVTVLKSAGGCGSSMIAANIAAEFARVSEEAVALVDLDVQFGNLALYLDLRPRHSLLDALQAGDRLDATFLKSMMAVHESGVELLAAPRHMIPLECIDEAFLANLICSLKSTYPITVIELPSGWSDWFGGVFAKSDELVVASEATVRCAAGLSRVLQSLEDMSATDASLCVIANKVQSNGDARRRVEQMRSTLRYPVETIAFDDKAADRAANAGMLLSETAARTKTYKDLREIAGNLIVQLNPPTALELYSDNLLENQFRRSSQ